MAWGYEENVLSILRGRERWKDKYSSVSEFIHHLNEETALEHEKLNHGCVLRRSNERQQQPQSQIIALLKATASTIEFYEDPYIFQFWAVVKVEGRHHHLSSSDQPFYVSELKKGVCEYRKLCRAHVYVVDMDGGDTEKLSCVGRAYRSMHHVSSPDLRLFSTHDLPMRDDAARCRFRGYMALPLFDLYTYQYYGVLELISHYYGLNEQILSSFDQSLKIAGLRSTHSPIFTSSRQMQQSESEITDMIELAMTTVPRLYQAQVWVPCKQCVNMTSNLCCMEMLISRIVEMNLKSFKFLDDSKKSNAIGSGSIDSLNVLKSYEEIYSESNFTTYLEMAVDSCCLRPIYEYSGQGWVFRWPNTDRSCENDVKSNSSPIKEKVENFMKDMAVRYLNHHNWIMQFWAPEMEKDRCYLKAFDQPYAVGCLAKGIASFRKKCMTHYYPVDDKAKEDELGPPGCVFRNGHPEISPDLFHYTEKEFSIRNYAMHCLSREYFSLPIFDDEYNHKCVGVMECLGFCYSDLEDIRRKLEVANLCSTHIDFQPKFLSNEPQPANIHQVLSEERSSFLQPVTEPHETKYCRTNALIEINNALKLICYKIPQLYMANVWVPNRECFGISSNTSCMELALSTKGARKFMPTATGQVHRLHVQAGKGMVGMVLASENKSCFCQNLCEFSIADQPLSHFEMSDRRNICFAIGLQSSYTDDLVYVMEFFLYQGPNKSEYIRSFLNFLLPVMKIELKSFKVASGKQLEDELVVEVIEFSEADKLDYSESEEVDVFPIKFKSVQYGQKEHQHTEEQMEECNLAALDSKQRERGKRKTALHLSLEILVPHFGKKLKDVAEELGVGRSTIKRACRDYGIDRWPSNEKQIKNLSLFGGESCGVSQQETNTEISQHANVQKEAEKVIIKVKHEQDIVKFVFCLSLGLTCLIEEAATRLNLEIGSFKLKYVDEDDDEILLSRDDDLQLCPKTETATGKTCIQLLVRL